MKRVREHTVQNRPGLNARRDPGARELFCLLLHHRQSSDEETSSSQASSSTHPSLQSSEPQARGPQASPCPHHPPEAEHPLHPVLWTDTRWCLPRPEPLQRRHGCGFPPPPALTTCFLGLPLGRLPLLRFCTSFSCSLKKQQLRTMFAGKKKKNIQNHSGLSLSSVIKKKFLARDAVGSAPIPVPEQRLGGVLNPYQHGMIVYLNPYCYRHSTVTCSQRAPRTVRKPGDLCSSTSPTGHPDRLPCGTGTGRWKTWAMNTMQCKKKNYKARKGL